MKYSFHPKAFEQQIEIWDSTYQKWGEAQADKYIDGLHEVLSKMDNDVSFLRVIPNRVLEGILFFHYGRHYVFLRRASSAVEEDYQVLLLLHDRMDMPARLLEELKKIQ